MVAVSVIRSGPIILLSCQMFWRWVLNIFIQSQGNKKQQLYVALQAGPIQCGF